VEKALAHDRGFYRSMLAERLALRHTPDLRFVIDETVERSLRLEALLRDDSAEIRPEETPADQEEMGEEGTS
jgi:ribosome-binding factor A